MKFHSIDTGFFKLDGGAMFGVVPKSMWNKLNPADENNMCTWAMRCLLIEFHDRLILVDTGMGNKFDDKFASHFYPHGDATLSKSLAAKGFAMDDITDVILTHLHFDHCGGAIVRNEEQQLVTAFPKATYWSNSEHWNWALHPNAREKASFIKENILPIHESGQLKFIDNETTGLEEIMDIDYVFGHTEAMLIPHFYKKKHTVTYVADLIPSRHHIKMPYVMAYDIRPLETLKEKAQILEKSYENNHILFFEHDKDVECCTLDRNEFGIYFDNTFTIDEL